MPASISSMIRPITLHCTNRSYKVTSFWSPQIITSVSSRMESTTAAASAGAKGPRLSAARRSNVPRQALKRPTWSRGGSLFLVAQNMLWLTGSQIRRAHVVLNSLRRGVRLRHRAPLRTLAVETRLLLSGRGPQNVGGAGACRPDIHFCSAFASHISSS